MRVELANLRPTFSEDPLTPPPDGDQKTTGASRPRRQSQTGPQPRPNYDSALSEQHKKENIAAGCAAVVMSVAAGVGAAIGYGAAKLAGQEYPTVAPLLFGGMLMAIGGGIPASLCVAHHITKRVADKNLDLEEGNGNPALDANREKETTLRGDDESVVSMPPPYRVEETVRTVSTLSQAHLNGFRPHRAEPVGTLPNLPDAPAYSLLPDLPNAPKNDLETASDQRQKVTVHA